MAVLIMNGRGIFIGIFENILNMCSKHKDFLFLTRRHRFLKPILISWLILIIFLLVRRIVIRVPLNENLLVSQTSYTKLALQRKSLTASVGVDPCRIPTFKTSFPTSLPPGSEELVLVTGGSGFIGSNLVQELLNLGYRVRVLDNLSTGNIFYLPLLHPRLEFIYGDISNKQRIQLAMKGCRGVFHLAAASKVAPSLKDPTMATFNVHVNSIGTANILEVATKMEPEKVKKFVYAASSTFYGNQGVPHNELDPFVPSSPYAASKYMGELQTLTYDSLYKLPVLNLRFFMVYGPRQPQTGAYAIVTGKFIERVKRGEAMLIEGDGTHYRDFIHVEDLVRGIILGYQSELHDLTINLGSGEAHSIQEVADIVDSRPIMQKYIEERQNDLIGTLADTCLAKQLLGFATVKDFHRELRQLVEDAKIGANVYESPDWSSSVVTSTLAGIGIEEWKDLSSDEKNAKIKEKLESDPMWLEKFRLELFRK